MRQLNCRGVRAHSILRQLATGAAIGAMLIPMPALAGPPGCKAIMKGTLDVSLPAGQRSSRMVRLNAGETINFSVHAGASSASVTLVSGGDAPKTLLERSGMTTYAAPASATYVFAIEAGADSSASVSANCSRPDRDTAGSAIKVKEVEVAQIVADMDGTRGSAFSVGLSEFAAAAEAARAPVDRWADAADRAAVAIDTAAGHEDVSAATLSLSASAEVSPGDLAAVFARMDRVAPTDAPEDRDVNAALASALVGNDLTFEPQPATAARHNARRAVAKAAPTVAPEELWVTQLHEDRTVDSAVTETAVLRRDTVAGAAGLPPPMALGGLVPGLGGSEGPSPAPAMGFAQ